MCGIAGILRLDRAVADAGMVARMLEKIAHRGPDQRGIGSYGPLCLGMNRLSIIDRKIHEIPYVDSQSGCSLVYNGEIYNHRELREYLGENFLFYTDSDTETVLQDMTHFHTKHLSIYNGMYAISFWDARERALYLVRDKAGEKPLYYFQDQEKFVFASEIKAILEVIEKYEICLPPDYRAFEFCTGRQTMFSSIKQLLPGEYLRIDEKGNIHLERYWDLQNLSAMEDPGEDRIIAMLSELVEDAILLRTKNLSHNFSVFTGGGVDSALMACIARPNELHYCHYDLGKAFDELEYATLVSKKTGIPLKVVEPTKEDFERTRERIAWHLDMPATWTGFSLWMLLESLSEDIRVVMTGEGADEAFAGYHRYHLLHHDEQIHRLEAMQGYSYLIQRYYGSPVERYVKLINRNPNLRDYEVLDYLHDTVEFWFSQVSGDVVHGMGLCDLHTTMQVLLQMSDRLSMAHSVENRSPFLDSRLLEFAFSMPSKYKIKNGITKWVFKEVARKFIPPQIVDRIDKRGFSAPVNIWFGWDKPGQYDRSRYREMAFSDWKKIYFSR